MMIRYALKYRRGGSHKLTTLGIINVKSFEEAQDVAAVFESEHELQLAEVKLLECPVCSNRWYYSGGAITYASCSRCGAKKRIEDMAVVKSSTDFTRSATEQRMIR